MKHVLEYEFLETVIPPRRKPRAVWRKETTTLEIAEVSGRAAPVAIVEVRDTPWVERSTPKKYSYRWFDGKLWTKVNPENGDEGIPTTDKFYGLKTAAEAFDEAEGIGHGYLLIDGELHAATDEPKYVVMTFGLGHNHGGTSLSIDSHYNPNIPWRNYYRLDERLSAVREAERVARDRGDTKSIPITTDSKFRILIPEAIQARPKMEHGEGTDALCNIWLDIAKTGKPNSRPRIGKDGGDGPISNLPEPKGACIGLGRLDRRRLRLTDKFIYADERLWDGTYINWRVPNGPGNKLMLKIKDIELDRQTELLKG
jgi:hypothetical protein